VVGGHLLVNAQIAPGDRRGRERRIRDAGGENAGGVERPGEAFDPGRRQQAKRRLEAGDAAKRGRANDRTAGLGSERDRHHAGRNRCGRPRR
jgi:hypothetical protein